MSVIVSYQRTPYGRLLGGLSSLSATELGAIALTAALEQAGVAPAEVSRVVAGQVLQAGAGQNPARQSAVQAGIPLGTPALTINAVCLSGMEAVLYGHRLIASGHADIVACVGQESMSTAPHIFPNSRVGTKYGSIEVVDTMERDGLTDAFGHCSMGVSTERGNSERLIDRGSQDEWAARSHQRAATSGDFFAGEITPVSYSVKGKEVVITSDEGVRADTTVDTLSALRPAFDRDGTITAGNASPISDGAAAVLLMSEAEAFRRGLRGVARVVGEAFVAGPDTQLHSQPSRAIQHALAQAGRTIDECQVIEINEAFASVALQSITDLGVSPELVNVHGGAIALGHPIGSSGTRITGTLARELAARGPGLLGAAGICGGGGQGMAILLESI